MNGLFPFYVLFDKKMAILNCGTSIIKLIPQLDKGGSVLNFFEVHLPKGVNTIEALIKHQPSLFLITVKSKSDLKLRGQIYYDEKHQLFCFLGSPLLNSLADLKKVNLSLNNFAVHDSIGQFLFTLQLQASSIKDSKELSDKLTLSNKRLESTIESLDAFSYRLTHDLRAPTINVDSMLKLLGNTIDIETESDTKTIYNHAYASTSKLLETIDAFLELAKAERLGVQNPEECSILEIINETKEKLKQSIADNDAKIILEFDTECTVLMVKEDLESVFLNLISNAIKYRSKERTPKITIRVNSKGRNLNEIIIFDNGAGIDLIAQKNKIFKMFSRFHVDSSIPGTGIGLYLVKKLIDKNGGQIKIESKIDKGTIFTITLAAK